MEAHILRNIYITISALPPPKTTFHPCQQSGRALGAAADLVRRIPYAHFWRLRLHGLGLITGDHYIFPAIPLIAVGCD